MSPEQVFWIWSFEIMIEVRIRSVFVPLRNCLFLWSSACACTSSQLVHMLAVPFAVCRADRLASGHSDFLRYMRLLKALDYMAGR